MNTVKLTDEAVEALRQDFARGLLRAQARFQPKETTMSIGALFVVAGIICAILALAGIGSAPWIPLGLLFVGIGVLVGANVTAWRRDPN